MFKAGLDMTITRHTFSTPLVTYIKYIKYNIKIISENVYQNYRKIRLQKQLGLCMVACDMSTNHAKATLLSMKPQHSEILFVHFLVLG